MKFKCHTCYTFFDEKCVDTTNKKCPNCGETHILPMCENDHLCTCTHEHSEGLKICPKCGQPMCPCGSHDVVVISRVTGYLSDIAGWNNAKRQELIDRQRYDSTAL